MNAADPVPVAKWLGLAFAAAMALLLLVSIDGAEVVLLNFLVFPWLIGPVALAAMAVKASRTRLGACAFLTVGAAIVASTVADWTCSNFGPVNGQAGIALGTFLPAAQYAGLVAWLILVSLLGWRVRSEWLNA